MVTPMTPPTRRRRELLGAGLALLAGCAAPAAPVDPAVPAIPAARKAAGRVVVVGGG
jgi:hypothetical protein